MGCASCGQGLTGSYQNRAVARKTPEECEYDIDMIVIWKDKLFCIRDNEKYTDLGLSKAQLNRFLGVVLSCINFSYNICFLANQLDKIKPYIIKIVGSNLC